MKHDLIPDDLIGFIKSKLGDDASTVLDEVQNIIMLEQTSPPMVDNGRTYGDWNIPLLSINGLGDYRPGSSLPLHIIEQMLKSAPVRFALEMKRAQIVSIFRNKRSWKIQSPDRELAEIVTANLMNILPKMSLDFSFSSLAYGVSFQEIIWEYRSKYELGISDSKYQSNKKFVVAKIPNSVNPTTVLYIKRTEDGHFNGFVQQSKVITGSEINIPRDASLIIPYDEKFRNLWGESLLKPMYPIWYWYEVVLRSMVKYMERTGTPVTLVKAPSRINIIKPGTKKKVDSMSWGMEIASNVARSNAAVIPSDTDDQGRPLWDLSYLNSTEKSQPFMDILELLTQMILRAGLSADRALMQSSGGVGSYNIGELHQQATALHNEVILIQWLHCINSYFLPLYSLYNRGRNGPPIWIETQGLDPTDRNNLTTLLGVAQNMDSFKNAGYRIDWETLLETNNIPLLSEADGDAIKKKQEEENLSKQENMLNVQSKFNSPSPTKQSDGSLKANLPNKVATDKKVDSSVNAEDTEEVIKLFNPYHDKSDGRFSSKRGGSSIGVSINTAEVTSDIVNKAASGSVVGSIVKTTGAVLGIGGVGVVGLAVIGAANNASDKEARRKELEKKIATTQQSLDAMTSNWPKSSTKEEAVDTAINELKKIGLTEIPDDLVVNFSTPPSAGAIGEYRPDTNTLYVDPTLEKGLLAGDPATFDVLLHELAHSEQEFAGNTGDIWGNDSEIVGDRSAFRDYFEGQNDLVTKLANSQLHNQELDSFTTADLSKEYNSQQRELDSYENALSSLDASGGTSSIRVGIISGGQEISSIGYPSQTEFYAGLAAAYEEKTGISAKDFLLEAHKYGFSQNEMHQDLVDVFPDEMKANGYYKEVTTKTGGVLGIGGKTTTKVERSWPSQGEVRVWMSNHGYKDPEKALKQMLKEAANG